MVVDGVAELDQRRQLRLDRAACVVLQPVGRRRGASASESPLSDDRDDIARSDRIADGDLDFLDRPCLLGVHVVLHLHRLEHADGLAHLDRVTRRSPGP